MLYLLGARELSENVWNFHVFNVFAAAMAGHALVLVASIPTGPAAADDPAPAVFRHPHPLRQHLERALRPWGRPPGLVRVAALALVIVAFRQYRLADFYNPKHACNSHLLGSRFASGRRPTTWSSRWPTTSATRSRSTTAGSAGRSSRQRTCPRCGSRGT